MGFGGICCFALLPEQNPCYPHVAFDAFRTESFFTRSIEKSCGVLKKVSLILTVHTFSSRGEESVNRKVHDSFAPDPTVEHTYSKSLILNE